MFRTYDAEHDRLVAVKALRLDLTPEQSRELIEELQRVALLGLSHLSLVKPVDAGVEGTTPYLAEEYIAAESLDVALRQYAPAPLDMVLPFIKQVGGAIDHAAAAGVLHGGLHPRDIYLTAQQARATGFGIAAALEQVGLRPPIRRPYSAPERIDGGQWGPRADVFSLAAIAFELLTGRRIAGTGDRFSASAEADPNVTAEIEEVLRAGLAAEPSHRYPSALVFVAALETACGAHAAVDSADSLDEAASAGRVAASGSSVACAAPQPSDSIMESPEATEAEPDSDRAAQRDRDQRLDREPTRERQMETLTDAASPDVGDLLVSNEYSQVEPVPPADPEAAAEPALVEERPAGMAGIAAAAGPRTSGLDPEPLSLPMEVPDASWGLEGGDRVNQQETEAAPGSAEDAASDSDDDVGHLAAHDEEAYDEHDDQGERAGHPEGDRLAAADEAPGWTAGAPVESTDPWDDTAGHASGPSDGVAGPDAEHDLRPAPYAARPRPWPPPAASPWRASRWSSTALGAALGLGMLLGFVAGYQWRSPTVVERAVVVGVNPGVAVAAGPTLSHAAGPDVEDVVEEAAPVAAISSAPVATDAPAPVDEPAGGTPPSAGRQEAATSSLAGAPRAVPMAANGRSAPQARNGRLLVRSTPAGAPVLLDGARRGVTPLVVRNLAYGSYQIQVSPPGGEPQTRRLTVTRERPSATVTFDVTSRPPPAPGSGEAAATGSLYIDSRPRGARVVIDGAPFGRTPLLAPGIATGAHEVELDLDGYRHWTSSVQVRADQRNRVTGSLDPQRP